jgi:hypothetical protein
VCRNTACVVAEACPDDANEDNDYIEDATLLVGGQRVSAYICPSDQDVYALEVRSGCQVRVEVDFTHSAGDIDAVLLSEDETELRPSTSSNNDEELSYTFQTSGTYYVVVYGYDDPDANEYVENDYAITATFTNCPEPPPTCPGDDRLEPNDATEEASTITPGQLVEGIVCGAQEDYFTFNAPEGCNVSAELVYEQTDGDLALALLDGMGTTLTEVNGTTGEEAATLEEINGGAYFARVSGGEGSASFYLLQITVSGCVGQTGRLLLSEVFYDPDATEQGGEWVEIFNDSASEIDLSGYSLGAGGTSYAALKVQLTGTIAPGACRVIGGPTSNAATYNPRYDQVVDFWAIAQGGLQNGGSASDGVALFNMPASGVTGSTMPIDAVVYDSPNSNNLRDETGAVARPVAAPASGQSIERTREGWRTQATPNPNACTPLSSF